MSDPATSLTPQEKLTISRKAFVRLMARDDRSRAEPPEEQYPSGAEVEPPVKEGNAFSAMGYAVQTWWRHHPAHAALEVARPFFDRYAARRPVQVLGIAVAIGAAVVLIRPWRLVSIGGLLLAAVKSATTPGVLLSMLSTRPNPSTKKPSTKIRAL